LTTAPDRENPIQTMPGITIHDNRVRLDSRIYSVEQSKRILKQNGLRWVNFKIANKMEKEVRLLNTEFRVMNDGKVKVRGLAAVFNSLSENLGGFRERIEPGAFDDVLKDDVRAMFNHDPNMILGRSKSGTLKLEVTPEGLAYEYEDPDTTYSRDLVKSLERGDVDQSSFGFQVKSDGQEWRELEDGSYIRTIKKVSRLYDVSPVTIPAYPDTTVAKRDLNLLEQQKADIEMKAEAARLAEEESREREEQLRELTLKKL